MKNLKKTTKYEDILHLPHHVSSVHPQMSIYDRAAQFSPFAALTGHDAAIKETARLTEQRVELDENEKAIINEALQKITKEIKNYPAVSLTYFQPDTKKEGGTYVRMDGNVKKIDLYNRCITLEDGHIIPIDEIFEISCDILPS